MYIEATRTTEVPAAPPVDFGRAEVGALPLLSEPADASVLLAIESRSTEMQIRSIGLRGARLAEQAAALARERLERLKEQAAKENDQGFWAEVGGVAKAVVAVTAVAGSVVTCGATLAAAAVVLSATYGATGGTFGLDKLGVDKTAAMAIAGAVTVASSAATAGALSLGAAAATVSVGSTASGGTLWLDRVGVDPGLARLTTGVTTIGLGVAAAVTAPAVDAEPMSPAEMAARAGTRTVDAAARAGEARATWEGDLAGAAAARAGADAGWAEAQGRVVGTERDEGADAIDALLRMHQRVVDLAIEMDEATRRTSQAALRV